VGTLSKYISAIALADGGTGATTGLATNYALPVMLSALALMVTGALAAFNTGNA
jgi:hypothetical protein